MPFLSVVFYLIFLYGINAKVMMVSVKARAKILVVQLTHLGIKLLKKEKKEKKKVQRPMIQIGQSNNLCNSHS